MSTMFLKSLDGKSLLAVLLLRSLLQPLCYGPLCDAGWLYSMSPCLAYVFGRFRDSGAYVVVVFPGLFRAMSSITFES